MKQMGRLSAPRFAGLAPRLAGLAPRLAGLAPRLAGLALSVLLCAGLGAPPAHAEGGWVVRPYWSFQTSATVEYVQAGDVDGDGTLEVVALTTDDTLYVLENDGRLAWRYDVEFPAHLFMVADLDGDGGAAEILVGGRTATMLLRDTQRPACVSTLNSDVFSFCDHWVDHLVTAADLDGDGRPEALHATGLGIATMDAACRPGPALEYVRQRMVDMWTGDVNGDGRPDIVPTFTLGGDKVYMISDITSDRPAWQQRIGERVGLVQGGDVDGDGQAEVAVLSYTWGLYLLESDGSPAWHTQSLSVTESECLMFPGQLVVHDLDGDGRAEILVMIPTPVATLHVFDGRGGLLWQHRFDALPSAKPNARLAAGDVNGDGQAEVLVAPLDQPQLYLLDAGGRRLAEYRTWKHSYETIGTLDLADLDGDGSGDILVGTESGVQVFGTSSQAVWGELWQASYLAGPVASIYLHGSQGAGQGEVIAGSQDGQIHVLTDEGRVLWDVDLKSAVVTLSAGDVDRDTRLEVVVGTRSGVSGEGGDSHSGPPSSQLHLLDEGQPIWSVPLESPIHSLAVHDLDGDGRAKIMAGIGWGSRGALLLLNGAGEMTWQREFDEPVTAVGGDGDQVLAGTQSGRVVRLTAAGAPVEEYELGARVLSLDAGLAATADGRVYRLDGGASRLVRELDDTPGQVQLYGMSAAMLAGGKASLLTGDGTTWPGSVDGRVTSVAAGDLNGDGEAELAVGADGGGVALFGLTFDQPPMLSGSDLAETRAGYVYSVNVNDPERRPVTVTLEIWDPSTAAWLRQAAQPARGQAHLTWEVANPFDTWDAGRESRYRFVYDDGNRQRATQERGGPFTIPTTPPALYYGQRAGLAALLLLVPGLGLLLYRRQRAYHLSPLGQAEATLRELRASPGTALPWLHAMARSDSLQMATLPDLARQAGQTDIADLSEGFHLMASRPEVAGEGLRTVVEAMQRFSTPPGQPDGGMLDLYTLLQRLLEANTVARIVALQPQLDRPARFGEDLAGLDMQVADALAKLNGVAGALHNNQRVDMVEDKLAYLAQAIEDLSRLEREFQAELPAPERNVFARVAAGWLTVVSQALQDVQGRAQLEVALRTRQVLQAGALTLALELTNTGRSPAANVCVALASSPDHQYQAGNGAAHLDILPAGRSAVVEIPVAVAPALDHLRAEFSITFDDRERAGKSLEFADLVHLVRPEAGFQPLPNPYAPGTPLSPGSPLFFGREDLFQFVAENMAGLARQNILVLTGQRRMGKTSFLQQLPARLGQDYLPVFLDGQSLGVDPGMANFFYDLALAIADALAERGIRLPEPQPQDFSERPSAAFERTFLPAAFEAIGGRQLLLLFDEFEELETRVAAGKLEPAIFPFFRHLMQHGGQLGFIFVGTHRLEALSADYWSIFFNIALYKHVTTLDERAARALIVQPLAAYGLRYDDLAVDKMLRMTAGHPYFLQLTCHALVNRANRQRRGYLTIQDVNDVLGEMMELGEAHFAFLWEESSPAERLVLAALSRLLGQEPAVTVAQMAELLAARGISLPAGEVAQALERLTERDILRQARGQPPRHDYKVGLVHLWVERHKPLGQVIEEVG